jgi:hypothetical protein
MVFVINSVVADQVVKKLTHQYPARSCFEVCTVKNFSSPLTQ